MKNIQFLKANHPSKKWCNYCRRYGHSISECRQKQQDNQNKPQTIEIRITQTIDQEIIHLINQTITDQMTIIKTDHGIIHKIEIQVIIVNIEIIPSHHIGIITIIIILNIDTEVVHQNIKDILIKYSQMKKQHQTPQVLMTQEVTNYN